MRGNAPGNPCRRLAALFGVEVRGGVQGPRKRRQRLPGVVRCQRFPPYLSRIRGGEDSPVGTRRDGRRKEWGSIRAVGDELADVAVVRTLAGWGRGRGGLWDQHQSAPGGLPGEVPRETRSAQHACLGEDCDDTSRPDGALAW